MKKFLTKAIIFMLFPILYFGINMGINYYIYTEQDATIENKNILIVGDSHIQGSLNPKYFLSAQNISQKAEPYVITYWKLKKITNSFIPDTVIIGFAPHNISQFNDIKFSDEKWSSELFKRSYPIQEFRKISNDVPVDYKAFYKTLWLNTAFFPKKNHINYIGFYTNSNYSELSTWGNTIKRHYFNEGKEFSISSLSINYLDSIAELCNSNNIELILVSNPVFEQYQKNIPSSILNKHSNLMAKYAENHIVFDKTMEKYPDSLFLDSDHLNLKGSEKFTKEFIKHIDELAIIQK